MVKPLEFPIRAKDESGRGFRSVENRATRLERGFDRLGARVKAAFTVSAVTAFAGAIRGAISSTAQLVDTADKIGVGIESLQELRFAAEQNSVSIQALDMGMQRFSRRIAEAATGAGVLKDILKANNVALRDSEGRVRPLNDLLDDYAELIRNAGSEQEQLLLAFKAFDSEGAALVNVLRDGADGLDTYRARAQELDIVVKDELARSMKDIDDQFLDFTKSLTGKFKQGILEYVDAMRVLNDEMTLIDKLGAKLVETFGHLETAEERAAGTLRAMQAGIKSGLVEVDDFSQLSQDIRSRAGRLGKGDRLDATEPDKKTIIPPPGSIGRTTKATRDLTKANQDLADSYDLVGTQSEFMAELAIDGILSLRNGVDSLASSLDGLIARLIEAALRAALLGQGPLAGPGASGGLFGSLFPNFGARPLNLLAGLPGAQHGGMMTVPRGSGGPDSRLIAMKATPGENFIAVPPGSAMPGSGAQNLTVNIINAPPGTSAEMKPDGSGGQVLDVVIAATKRDMAQGGFDGTLSGRFGAQPRVTRKA